MSSKVEEIDVVCPGCGQEYIDWYQPSFDPVRYSICPRCGHEFADDPLVHEDGIWTLVMDEADALEH